jgi:hypothetical protein
MTIDANGKEFGIGRPYLGRDPPHVAPIDGQEYAAHHRGTKVQHAANTGKHRLAMRDDRSAAKTPKKRKVVQTGSPAKQGATSHRATMAMAVPGHG